MPDQNRKRKTKSESAESQNKTAAHTHRDRSNGAEPGRPQLGIVGTTSRVVYQAASILEEEIAAGIVAAKEVETSLLKSSKLPQGQRNVLMQRFRQDLHQVVDMILDVIDVAAQYADVSTKSDGASPGVKMRQKARGTGNGHLAMLMVPGPVKVGESANVAMSIKNNADKSIKLRFQSTALASASGEQIPAQHVEFSPSAVTLKPNASEDINIVVSVPPGKSAGTFVGLVQTTGKEQPPAVLVVQVG